MHYFHRHHCQQYILHYRFPPPHHHHHLHKTTITTVTNRISTPTKSPSIPPTTAATSLVLPSGYSLPAPYQCHHKIATIITTLQPLLLCLSPPPPTPPSVIKVIITSINFNSWFVKQSHYWCSLATLIALRLVFPCQCLAATCSAEVAVLRTSSHTDHPQREVRWETMQGSLMTQPGDVLVNIGKKNAENCTHPSRLSHGDLYPDDPRG